MSYHPWVTLLLNSSAALAIAIVLPRVFAGETALATERMPWWLYVASLLELGVAIHNLSHADGSVADALAAIWLAAISLAGTATKWTLAVVRSRGRSFHERSLVKGLLANALGLAVLSALLPDCRFAVWAVCWFANGFLWQAVFDDVLKILPRAKAR